MPITKKQRKASRFANALKADMTGKTQQSLAVHSMEIMKKAYTANKNGEVLQPKPPKKAYMRKTQSR
jgi:hypothetical protein